MAKLINLEGQKFGRLTVEKRGPNAKNWHVRWHCVCDCGQHTLSCGQSLKSGNTRSCGCLASELTVKRNIKMTKHGLSRHPIQNHYAMMMRRCYNPKNPKFKNYGQKGIKVCEEWKNSLSTFISWAQENGWEKGLSIDRVDNDGDYKPSNCQWLTVSDNSKKQWREWREKNR